MRERDVAWAAELIPDLTNLDRAEPSSEPSGPNEPTDMTTPATPIDKETSQ